jgi:hypothetical protein
MTRNEAIQALEAVVAVVVEVTVVKAKRVRLLAPWVNQARDAAVPFAELSEPLSVLLRPDQVEMAVKARAKVLSDLFSVSAGRAPKTRADYPSWQARIAEAAGVDLPGSARTADDAPSAHKLVAQLVQSNMNLSAALAANATRPVAARPVVTLTKRTAATPTATITSSTVPATATNPGVPAMQMTAGATSVPKKLSSVGIVEAPSSVADARAKSIFETEEEREGRLAEERKALLREKQSAFQMTPAGGPSGDSSNRS